jgi:cation:H+ antiporter
VTASQLVLSIVGLVLLIGGAELLVRGAVRIAAVAGISPLVVGMTVVALGTSAPEFAVGIRSSLAGQPDLALGNAVGSNISNVLLILGVTALVKPIVVHQKLVKLDVPLMIGASALLLVMSLDGGVGRIDGAALFALLMAYMAFSVRASRRETLAVKAEYEKEYGVPDAKKEKGRLPIDLALVIVGLVGLVIGAGWLVDGAVALARSLGVSELVVGLTVVAVGTSLPEIATSLIAAKRGEGDIAVGNVVGSNLFNILGVLGASAMVAPSGVPVARAALRFDIPVMIAVSVACVPIFFHDARISRWEAGLLVAHYLGYLTYIVLTATEHAALPAYTWVMLALILPLTAITLVVLFVRAMRALRAARAPKDDAAPGS